MRQASFDPADHVGSIYRSASALSGYMDKMEVIIDLQSKTLNP